MPRLLIALQRIDYLLVSFGGMVVALVIVQWWRRGRGDPLRGSPIRANRLSLLLVWVCFLVNLLGWTIGAQVAMLAAPAGLGEEALRSWRALLAANLMQVLIVPCCLVVAGWAFRSGWRGFAIGRRAIRSELVCALGGWLAALCLCNLVSLATMSLIRLLRPTFIFPDHTVFKLLNEPSATASMRALAIGGALILAPVGEELFFRGILQTGIKKLVPRRWGSMRHRWIAIASTALLFAFMHTATPHHVAALAAFGVVLGYLYERRGSLAVPILVHMLFNGKSVLWYELQQWHALPMQLTG